MPKSNNTFHTNQPLKSTGTLSTSKIRKSISQGKTETRELIANITNVYQQSQIKNLICKQSLCYVWVFEQK